MEMTEENRAKFQLVCALVLSNQVEAAQPHARREALEALHAAIQSAREQIKLYAIDVMTDAQL